MSEKENSYSLLNPKIWRHLVNFWTLVLFVMIFSDFILKNIITEFLGPVCAIYVALLAIYTADKEFQRWHHYNLGRHPGEKYVIAWTGIIIILFILEIYTKGLYRLPNDVITTYIVVLGILAITKKSKRDYVKKIK